MYFKTARNVCFQQFCNILRIHVIGSKQQNKIAFIIILGKENYLGLVAIIIMIPFHLFCLLHYPCCNAFTIWYKNKSQQMNKLNSCCLYIILKLWYSPRSFVHYNIKLDFNMSPAAVALYIYMRYIHYLNFFLCTILL